MLQQEDIIYIDTLLNHIKNKVQDVPEKLEVVTRVLTRLNDMRCDEIHANITESEMTQTLYLLDKINEVSKAYLQISDSPDPALFEKLKIELQSYLASLGTLCAKVMAESTRLEDKVKKELKAVIINELCKTVGDNGKTITVTQAERLVEADIRYLSAKAIYHDMNLLALRIRNQYDFGKGLVHSIMQSVSVNKEQVFTPRTPNNS